MSHFVAVLLGFIQGLTEFFPVSSSAHLVLAKELFGVKGVPVIFDLACHLGTLLALVWFFKMEIIRLFRRDRTKLVYLCVALVPLVPSYFLLGPLRKMLSQPEYLGIFLMVTGGILLLGSKVRIRAKSKLLRDVLLIGTMQSAALIPGISRSASTISCAHLLGWNTKDAVRFSFLLAIPTIIGGNIIETQKMMKSGQLSHLLNWECLIGFAAAFIMGMVVIRFAIGWLEKGNLKVFAWYCLFIGLIANIYMYLR